MEWLSCCRRRPVIDVSGSKSGAAPKAAPKPSAEKHRRRGNDAFKNKNFDSAVMAYSDALDLDPTDASLWVNRSIAQRHLSAWVAAIADADRALDLEPFNDKAHYGKAVALQKSGKLTEALEAIAVAIECDPENKNLLQLRRSVEEELNPPEKKRLQQPKPTQVPCTEDKKRDCSVNYSKWKNIVDSDDEVEADDYNLNPEGDVAEAGQPILGKNLDKEARERIIEDVIEVVRNMTKANSKELGAITSKLQKQMCPALADGEAGEKSANLPADYGQPVGVLTVEQLGQYTCSSARMLTSVYGRIFDVSCRPDEYGNGPKSWYSGHDITWALLVGTPTMKNLDRFYDIFKVRSEEQLNRLLRLVAYFLLQYQDIFVEVGRLDKFVNEHELPEPPTKEVESCPTQ